MMAVSKHKRRNSWYASFYYVDWMGVKRRKKKEGFATKKEAAAFERDFIERAAGECDMSFASFAQVYFDYCKSRLKVSTYSTKKAVSERYLLPYFRTLAMKDIKPKHILQWQEVMLKDYNLSSGYLKYIHSQLAALFNFAERYYYLSKNPVKQCNMPGNDKKGSVQFWTLEQFTSFTANLCRHSSEYVIFHLLFWTGLRRGEMLALCPEHFNFEQKCLNVECNLIYVRGVSHLTTPKTKSSRRSICLPDFLLKMVQNHIQRKNIKRGSRLFDLHPSKLSRCIKRICKKINLEPISLHGLRHSHASMLIEQGVQPMLIAERLGHKNVQVTLNVYSHLYPNKQKDLAGRLNELYER